MWCQRKTRHHRSNGDFSTLVPDQLYIINMMCNDVQVSEYLCPSTVQMETPHFVLSILSFSWLQEENQTFSPVSSSDFGVLTLSSRVLGAGWQNQVSEQNSPVQMTADDTLKTISEFLRWRWKNLGWQIVPAELSERERRILWRT